MNKKIIALIAVVFSLLLLAACGSDNNINADDVISMGPPTEIDVAQAQSDYMRCAACHGQNMEGGPFGGYILEPLIGMSYEKLLIDIIEGPGTMPANMVQGDRARNLAAWIAELE